MLDNRAYVDTYWRKDSPEAIRRPRVVPNQDECPFSRRPPAHGRFALLSARRCSFSTVRPLRNGLRLGRRRRADRRAPVRWASPTACEPLTGYVKRWGDRTGFGV